MADLNIADIREKYPQYSDMSDAQLAQGLHQKFYADMPFNTFAGKIGYREEAPSTPYSPDSIPAPTGAAPSEDQPQPSGLTTSISHIADAAAQGWRDTPSFLTPEAQAGVDKYGGVVGQTLVNPALKVVSGGVAAAHAGIAALSQAAMEVFGEKGGRDALALLGSIPTISGERMSPNAASQAAGKTATARPRFMTEITAPDVSELDPRNAIATLIQHDIEENPPISGAPDRGKANQGFAATPADVLRAPDIDSAIAAADSASRTPYVPVTARDVAARDGIPIVAAWRRAALENADGASKASVPDAAPLPAANDTAPLPFQSVGAAASREQTPSSQVELSTPDMKANRRVAEMGELMGPPKPGDNAIYVPGSFPTLAERSGDPVISQTEHLLRERNSGAFVGDGKILTENNKARVSAYEAETIPDTTLNTMRADRSAQWEADSKDILPNARPVDLAPVADWVDNELSNPRIQENDAVKNVLENFRDRLVGDDGSLKDDPAAAWGMHDHLQNLLAKAKDPLNMTGAEKFAEGQIITAKAMIDRALNIATDNQFETALRNYAEASRAINAGTLLNDFRPKLTNMAGDIQAASFHRFVLGLAKERGNPGLDPSMDISDQTMRSLINIDTDLKRAGLIRLGGALGSPTNLLGALAENIGVGAAHKVMGKIPGVGPLLEAGSDFFKQRQIDQLTKKHIAPPEGGYVYPTTDRP